MEKQNILKTITAGLGTGLTWLFGGWDIALQVLIVLIAADYITGLMKGWINKELSSDIGLKGIARKAIIFIVLIVAVCLDKLLNSGSWVFRTMVAYFYIANEGLSILENVVEISLGKDKDVPQFLVNALKQIKEKTNNGESVKGAK